jgi:cell division protein FtsL
MSQFNTLLIALLVGCALSLVTAQYKERVLFIELERAEAAQKKLDIDWNQLQIDQTTYSKHALIDSAARRDLHMQPVTPARTHYLTVPPTIPPAQAPQEPGAGK